MQNLVNGDEEVEKRNELGTMSTDNNYINTDDKSVLPFFMGRRCRLETARVRCHMCCVGY